MNPFGTNDVEEVDEDNIWFSDTVNGWGQEGDLSVEPAFDYQDEDDPVHLRE